MCETTGYERKYANRLLTGSRKFREHKGKGRTYGDDVAEVLKKVWREAGCPCLPYFKAEVGRWTEEYATQVAHIRPETKAMLLAMSDCTMSRLLSGEVRVKPGWVLDEHVLTLEQEASLRVYRAGISGMDLYRRVLKRLRKIRRIQATYAKAKHKGKDLSPFATRPSLAIRTTPSGTDRLHREGTQHAANNQRMSRTEERRLSVQYLANQRTPNYLQSVFSI